MKYTKILITFLFLLFYGSCDKDEDTLFNEFLIFQNSYEIEIPSYKYPVESGDSVFVRGDLSYDSEIIDTLTSTPTLAWDSVESDLVCAIIFRNSIRVENSTIVNDAPDIAWLWHSGLPGGRNGHVNFNQGIREMNSSPADAVQEPDSLESGQIYYWGVWGWNSSGTEINFSSRELRFIVR